MIPSCSFTRASQFSDLSIASVLVPARSRYQAPARTISLTVLPSVPSGMSTAWLIVSRPNKISADLKIPIAGFEGERSSSRPARPDSEAYEAHNDSTNDLAAEWAGPPGGSESSNACADARNCAISPFTPLPPQTAANSPVNNANVHRCARQLIPSLQGDTRMQPG